MKQPGFEDLRRLPILRYYEDAFSKATGVSLSLVPPGAPQPHQSLGACQNVFCSLVASTPAGCDACYETHLRAQRVVSGRLATQEVHCFAGLTVVAVPIVISGQHVATLLSGQVFREEPKQRDFTRVLKLVNGSASGGWQDKARVAYFNTPVVSPDRFQAIVHLLSVFAQLVAEYASKCVIIESGEAEPGPVAEAKRFVQSHVEEPAMLSRVVSHVHLNRFYFCKLFKKSTGMTLTEYVSRVRVEKAKTLLLDASLRITDVVYAAGFGSIPRFNSVFKRYSGMAPTEYRESLRQQLHAPGPALPGAAEGRLPELFLLASGQ